SWLYVLGSLSRETVNRKPPKKTPPPVGAGKRGRLHLCRLMVQQKLSAERVTKCLPIIARPKLEPQFFSEPPFRFSYVKKSSKSFINPFFLRCKQFDGSNC